MASEFIEIISEQTKAQIDAIMPLVDKLASKIKEINSLTPSNTPSGADKSIQNMNTALKEQATVLNTVKTSLSQVNEQKQKSISLTTQQKVDNSIILKQEKQQATLTSEYAKAYEKLNMQRTIAKQKLQDLISAEKSSSSEIRKAQKEFDILNKKVAAADKAVGRFSDANRKINGLASSVGNLMSAFGIATGIGLAAGIAKNIYETTKEIQSLNLALKSVTKTQEEFSAQQIYLKDISSKYGVEIKSLTKEFTDFYVSAKDKTSSSQIQQIFKDISRSGSALGASTESMERGFRAITQMMSKGTVASEELRGQLAEALPGSVQAMTRAVQKLHPEIKNLTEKGLFEMIKKGKILANEVLPETARQLAIITGADSAEGIETITKSTNRLKDAWVEFIKFISENDTVVGSMFSGAMEGLTLFLQGLQEILSTQDQINKNRQDEQFQQGSEDFTSSFESNFGKKNKQEQTNYLNARKKELTEYVNEQEKEVARLTKIVDEASWLFPETEAKDMAEEISRNIGMSKGELYAINQLLNPVKDTSSSIDDVSSEQIKKREKADKDRRDAEEKHLKDLYDLKMAQLEKEKIILEESLNNEKLNYSEKLNIAFEISVKEMEIAQAKYAEEQRLNAGNNAKLKIADINFWKDKEKLAKDAVDRVNNIKYKPQYQDRNKLADEETFGVGVFETNPEQLSEMKRLWDKQQDDKDDIADREKDRLKSMSKVFNEFVGEFSNKVGFGDTFDFLAEQDKHGKTMFENMINGSLEAEEKIKAAFLAISTVAQDAFNMMSEASNKRFDKERNQLEKQKEIAIGFAGESDAAKKKIEEDYAKRQKEIDRREFKAKQKQTMVNIAMDTAQAIMATYGQAGFFGGTAGAIALAVIGAAQIAIVSSQKMPEYWGGTDDAQSGLAWTQERGAEIVTDKAGHIKTYGDNNGARLTMMEKGDKVYTAQETKRLMFDNELNSIMMDNGISNAPKVIVNNGLSKSDMRDIMIETLGSMTSQHVQIDGDGLKQYVKNGQSKTINLSNRVSGFGIRV